MFARTDVCLRTRARLELGERVEEPRRAQQPARERDAQRVRLPVFMRKPKRRVRADRHEQREGLETEPRRTRAADRPQPAE